MTDQTPPSPEPPSYHPAPQPTAAAPLAEDQDRLWASLAHLGGILFFLPSLLIWLILKDRARFTAVEAKEALNFQITAAIAWVAITIVNAVLTIVTFGIWAPIGTLLVFALWVVMIVFSILGFLKAKDGNHYRYPFAIRLIK